MGDYVTHQDLRQARVEIRAELDAAIRLVKADIEASISLLARREDIDRVEEHLTVQDEHLYELRGEAVPRRLWWLGVGALLSVCVAVAAKLLLG